MAIFRYLEIFRQLGDLLPIGHMEDVVFLENALHCRKNIWNSEGQN
jgi:hypothetical protein